MSPGEAHACDTPSTRLPGDEWRCPERDQLWWADDVPAYGAVFIVWRPASPPPA